MGCYIDGGRAVFTGSALTHNIWQQGFECCQGASPAPAAIDETVILLALSLHSY